MTDMNCADREEAAEISPVGRCCNTESWPDHRHSIQPQFQSLTELHLQRQLHFIAALSQHQPYMQRHCKGFDELSCPFFCRSLLPGDVKHARVRERKLPRAAKRFTVKRTTIYR